MVLISIGIGIVVALMLGLWSVQRRLIYFPGGDVPPVETVLPGWREATLATSDGLRLGAWYATPGPGQPVVVVFNGNAGSRADRTRLGSRLTGQGLGVLLVDYRGYGGNPGRPSEEGLALDARAAARFVDRNAPGHPLVLFGESLGAAVAVELAVEREPAALILRSPFASLADMVRTHYPLPGAHLLLRDEYPSDERIGAIGAPVLVIAGSEDATVPPTQSRELYELAGEPKELVVIPGADHNDAELVAGETMTEAIVRFIRDVTTS